MKSLHSYSAILDTIFFKMEEESDIVVDFTIGRGRSAGSQSGDFIINSVNGFATEVEFSSVYWKSRWIWIFNDPRFSGENIETVPRYALSQVLYQVSRFAQPVSDDKVSGYSLRQGYSKQPFVSPAFFPRVELPRNPRKLPIPEVL